MAATTFPSANIEMMNLIEATQEFTETACSSDTRSIYRLTSCAWAGETGTCTAVIGTSPEYGRVLFLDGELQSSEADEAIYHEHLVHPVLNSLARIPSKSVLIVGGGEGATAREVLKWESVAHVDWVDIDSVLVELCKRHMGYATESVYADPRLHFYGEDICSFLIWNTTKYDVIILDLPDPDVEELAAASAASTGLYSIEFMQTIRDALKPGGAIATHAGPVAPGGDPTVNRAGLTWIQYATWVCGMGTGHTYHTFIPSFQSEWGFWMSVRPSAVSEFPAQAVIMDGTAQEYAFTWPRFWRNTWTPTTTAAAATAATGGAGGH